MTCLVLLTVLYHVANCSVVGSKSAQGTLCHFAFSQIFPLTPVFHLLHTGIIPKNVNVEVTIEVQYWFILPIEVCHQNYQCDHCNVV